MRLSVAGLALLILGSLFPTCASAHVGHVISSAERYLKLDVSSYHVRVVVSLTLGPAEGRRVLEAADADGDGEVTRAESERYLAAWAEGLSEELPVSLDGEPLELVWGQGYLEPLGRVRRTALTVEMVARFELEGGEETVRFTDRMVRREVFDRTDVAFQVRGSATLLRSGTEDDADQRTPEFAYPGVFREGQDIVLIAVLRTPERADHRWLWGLGGGGVVLLAAVFMVRRRQ